MQDIKDTLIKTEKTTLFLMLAGLVPAIVLRRYFFAYGLAAGAVLGMLNFRLLAKSAVLFTGTKKKNPYFYFLLIYLGRFFIILVVFLICLIKAMQLFLGAAVGFLLVQVSIFLNNVWFYRPPLKKRGSS